MATHQSQGRHCHDIEGIAEEHHWPVALRAVSEPPEDIAQAIPHHLSETRHEANNRSRGTRKTQERSSDAVCTLVGHVRKKAHRAEEHDERHGCRHTSAMKDFTVQTYNLM